MELVIFCINNWILFSICLNVYTKHSWCVWHCKNRKSCCVDLPMLKESYIHDTENVAFISTCPETHSFCSVGCFILEFDDLVFHADQKYQKWTSIHGRVCNSCIESVNKYVFKYVFPAQINMFLAYLHRKIRVNDHFIDWHFTRSRAWVQSRLLLGYFWDQEDCCSHSSQHPPPPWHWRWRELIQHLSGWWRAMWQLDECLTPSKSTTPAHMTHSHVYYQPPTGTPCGPWA